jgi:hypothetical protein
MAIFRILFSRPQIIKDFEHHPEFDVQILSGSLEVEDKFCLYETHHQCWFTILEIKRGPVSTLVVDKPIRYFNWHQGTIVDTENPEAGYEYGYKQRDAQYLYHPDVLKGLNSQEKSIPQVSDNETQDFREAYNQALIRNERFKSELIQARKKKKNPKLP